MNADTAIARRQALLAGVVAVAASTWLGRHHHALLVNAPEASGSIEWDFYYSYMRDAIRIGAGFAPLDEFRGPLYPLVLAIIHVVLPAASLLTIAKLVSGLSCGVAAACAVRLGDRVVGVGWAAAVGLALVCAPTFLTHGVLAGTDMFFAALTIGATWLLIEAADRGSGHAALAGAVAGLALTARWNAVFLPAAALATALVRRRDVTPGRWRWLAAYGAALLVVVAPWWTLNAVIHGSPFHNRNAVNASLAIFGDTSHYDTIGAVIRSEPLLVIRKWAGNAVANLAAVSRPMMPLALLAVPGLVVLLRRGWRDRALWIPIFLTAALAAVNALGPFVPRQYLLFLPLLFVAAAAAADAIVRAAGSTSLVKTAAGLLWVAGCAVLLTRSLTALDAIRGVEAQRPLTVHGVADASSWPVIGDWDGDGRDEFGVARDEGGSRMFYVAIDPRGGPARWIAAFGPAGTTPLSGRWAGDRRSGLAVFAAGAFFVKHGVLSGYADQTCSFGDATGRPVVGDWNGDGADTVATFNAGRWVMTDGACGGAPREFAWGSAGDLAVAGDWNGDRRTTVGLFRNGVFLLTDRSGPPFDDIRRVETGIDRVDVTPFAADLDGTGHDLPGLYLPDGTFMIFGAGAPRVWRADLSRLDDLPVVK